MNDLNESIDNVRKNDKFDYEISKFRMKYSESFHSNDSFIMKKELEKNERYIYDKSISMRK